VSKIADLVAGLFKPVADVIEHIVPSGDKKLELQSAIFQAQMGMADKMMDYELALLDGQKSIIMAEASGKGVLQRNWRPITMLTFLALVVCDSFGWLPNPLASEAWTLLQIGLGGYVAGRSLEKVAPAITNAVAEAKKGK